MPKRGLERVLRAKMTPTPENPRSGGGLPAAAVRESLAVPPREPAGAVMECPLVKRYAIEVVVLGADGAQIAGIAVRLIRSASQTSGQVSEEEGPARFDGLIEGDYDVTLPDFDRDAWKLVEIVGLADKARSQGDMD